MKDMIFISHANNEDNEFCQWLAFQLAKNGYPVWCDLTKFLGGEDFWRDAEKAIREHTIKFLYVLSKASNIKEGPLKELRIAQNVLRENASLGDFIIPLRIDDLAHTQVNIEIARLTNIPFHPSRISGLEQLIDKLEKDYVAKKPSFSPDAVTKWWKQHHSANKDIKHTKEEYVSNWFPIQKLPNEIFIHRLTYIPPNFREIEAVLPYPAFFNKNHLLSFAPFDELFRDSSKTSLLDYTDKVELSGFLDHDILKRVVSIKERRKSVSRLLRAGWEKFIESRGLPIYQLANNARCFYFIKDMVENDTLKFMRFDEERSHRKVVGLNTRTEKNGDIIWQRYWHFGISAKAILYPSNLFAIRAHVLFSDDGLSLWTSKERMHSARRRACRNWWNAEWRDRILGTMYWLSGQDEFIMIPMSKNVHVQTAKFPISFLSPVSFVDPKKKTEEKDLESEHELEAEEEENQDV